MIVLNSQQIEEYSRLVDEIEDFEEWLDRIAQGSDLVYDQNFHFAATEEYQNIMNNIIESSLSDKDKDMLSELIMVQYKLTEQNTR